MKLIKRDINTSEKDQSGIVVLMPDQAEDMWHAYNMIAEGDRVTASTMRKVTTESSTGSSTSQRVHTRVTILVETIDFDTSACAMRLKGKNISENKYIKMGAYHTVDLELNRSFTLHKECWDFVALERLDLACDPAKSADIGAIIMQEGLAHICLVTSCMTTVRSRLEMGIPRKRRGNCTQHDKALVRFYDAVMQAMLRHFDFSVIKCVVVASPGFVKDQFFEYLYTEAVKTDNKLLFENKGKFLLAHSSSGHKYALKEVLQDPSVTSRLADTKAAGEVKALETFFQTLQNEPDRAYYGVKHVEFAAARHAVDVLMVTDELFRSNNIATRKRYINLIETVRETGADVRIFSSLHVSGEQLGQLTGVAAILRFPMPEIEDEDDEDTEEDEEESDGEGGNGRNDVASDGDTASGGDDSGAAAAASASPAVGNGRRKTSAAMPMSGASSRSATPSSNAM